LISIIDLDHIQSAAQGKAPSAAEQGAIASALQEWTVWFRGTFNEWSDMKFL
jgi:hypothetical protein